MGPTKRILIADGHPMIRRGVRALLETRADLEVVAEAATGREALEAAGRTSPDIAIVDHPLPELNGYLLCLQLRKAAPEIHILIYSGIDDDSTIRGALTAGASGFIRKSGAENTLFEAIDCVADGKAYFPAGDSDPLCRQHPRWPLRGAPGLTPREQEIVQLISEGRLNKQIAHLLALSVKTVETHRAMAMRKLGLHTTADLVRYALRNHIVST